MQTDDVARWIGTDSRTQWRALRCGPLAMHFDPSTAAIRHIRLGDRELVRAVYVAMRDRNWDTIEPQIADLDLVTADDGFRLTFTALCQEREIDFRWQGEITGEANGNLRFRMDGEAHNAFLRNRIGFCILHPIRECAGQPCIVTTADGATQEGRFPDLIAPHQPFFNLRGISHEAVPGVWAELRFDGDIFEMEDQRNWTDASYKTYCTPLSLPYPVEVPQGTRVEQAVSLTLRGPLPPSLPASDERNEPITLRVTDALPVPLPQIGLGMAGHGEPLSKREREILRSLHLAHLRLDLDLNREDWETRLQRAADEALALGAKLEVALFLTDDAMEARLTALADAVERLRPQVVRWLIFHADEKTTPERCLRAARQTLAPLTPDARFGGGTNAYFAELNRDRPPQGALDFVCWSINPQVHAFDTASIMENLEAQAKTVRSARAIYGDLPIVISPITLKPRFNPNATGPESPPPLGELPSQVDARQGALIGAAWTLASLKAMCESGVQSVTYYETTGWRGVMAQEAGSPLPERFPATPGGVFPLHAVFADLALVGRMEMWAVSPLATSDPAKIDGMALKLTTLRGNPVRNLWRMALCANLTPRAQALRLTLPPHVSSGHVAPLGAESLQAYALDPARAQYARDRRVTLQKGIFEWTLAPFGYLRLTWLEENNG